MGTNIDRPYAQGMDKRTKLGLAVVGGVLAVGVAALGIGYAVNLQQDRDSTVACVVSNDC